MTRRSERAWFGSVRKLPSGRVQARYTGPDSQRHSAPTTFLTLGDAQAWLAIQQSVASAEHGFRLRTRLREPTREVRPNIADRLALRQWIESLNKVGGARAVIPSVVGRAWTYQSGQNCVDPSHRSSDGYTRAYSRGADPASPFAAWLVAAGSGAEVPA